jgi:NTP pyrophosphatase (non-canonical NTP hydrolase)
MADQPVLEASKSKIARRRAQENVETWGQQAPGTLAAAIAEELGELLEAVLDQSGVVEPFDLTPDEYHLYQQLGAVEQECLTVQSILDDAATPDGSLTVPEDAEMDVQEVREELYDLMALCYQLDWALYQAVRADE